MRLVYVVSAYVAGYLSCYLGGRNIHFIRDAEDFTKGGNWNVVIWERLY